VAPAAVDGQPPAVSAPTEVTRWQNGPALQTSIASSGNETLVAFTDSDFGRSPVRAVRVARDGQVLDATPLTLGKTGDFDEPRVVWNGSAYVVGWHDSSAGFAVRLGTDGVILDQAPVPLPKSFLPGALVATRGGESLAFGDNETVRFGVDGARLGSEALTPPWEAGENAVWNGSVALSIARASGPVGVVARGFDSTGRLLDGELASPVGIESEEVGQRTAIASTRCGRILLAYSSKDESLGGTVERLRVRLLEVSDAR
jgi:hypothetical protein